MTDRRRAPARAVARPLLVGTIDLRAAIPSLRSLVIAVTILTLAFGAYLVALETSVFAVRQIQIVGGSPRVRFELRRALAPELGRSLLKVDPGAIDRSAAAIPDVVSVHTDRSFPNTLTVRVREARAVLLLRQGRASWIVSALGRVMRPQRDPRATGLPRLWVGKSATVSVGQMLPPYEGAYAAAAVAPIAAGALGAPVRTVVSTPAELTLVLRKGTEVRLGDIGDLRLKLAIAARILRLAGPAAAAGKYIDVSVPERPVLGPENPQVSTVGGG